MAANSTPGWKLQKSGIKSICHLASSNHCLNFCIIFPIDFFYFIIAEIKLVFQGIEKNNNENTKIINYSQMSAYSYSSECFSPTRELIDVSI